MKRKKLIRKAIILFIIAVVITIGSLIFMNAIAKNFKEMLISIIGAVVGLSIGGIGILFLKKAAALCPVCGEGELEEINRVYTGRKRSNSSTSGNTKTTYHYYEYDLTYECPKCSYIVNKTKYLNE